MPESASASACSSKSKARALPRNMLRGNWSRTMIRLRRRRGPSAQLSSSPAAARSKSSPKRARISSSRSAGSPRLSSPNQKAMRSSRSSAQSGSRPNQNSRTLRASSMALSWPAAVGLEELLELRRGFARGREELGLVLLDLILRGKRGLIVLAELAHGFARRGRGLAEPFQHPRRDLEARGVGIADDLGHPHVHQREGVLAIARAGVDLEARKVLARQCGSALRGIRVVDREHQDPGAIGPRGAQQLEPRGIAVVDLVAEAAHEIDVRLAVVEGGEGDPLHAQDACHDLPDAPEAGDDDRVVVLLDGVVGLLRRSEPAVLYRLVRNQQQGTQYHRERHGEYEEVRGGAPEEPVARGEREQHECELSSRRECEPEPPGRVAA